jgi:light-regulated signal transduction histidine kinase (bacteriophytochrome)
VSLAEPDDAVIVTDKEVMKLLDTLEQEWTQAKALAIQWNHTPQNNFTLLNPFATFPSTEMEQSAQALPPDEAQSEEGKLSRPQEQIVERLIMMAQLEEKEARLQQERQELKGKTNWASRMVATARGRDLEIRAHQHGMTVLEKQLQEVQKELDLLRRE